MSKLAALDHLLERYQALQYHQDEVLFQRLQDVQNWQKARLKASHHALFSQKNNQLMADYFVNRLYGGPDFDILANQIARLVKHAHKVEALIPEHAIHTGTYGIELSVLAVELDEQVAKQLLQQYPLHLALSDEMMRKTYLQLDQAEMRLKQLAMADEFSFYLDQHLRSFLVQTAFKMCKSIAYKHNFHEMYDFMQAGFIALKPLKSAENFVKSFTQQEREVIQKVHVGDLNPFRSV